MATQPLVALCLPACRPGVVGLREVPRDDGDGDRPSASRPAGRREGVAGTAGHCQRRRWLRRRSCGAGRCWSRPRLRRSASGALLAVWAYTATSNTQEVVAVRPRLSAAR